MAASALDHIVAARDNLALELANYEALVAGGNRLVTYTLDGETYDWNNYRLKAIEALKSYTELITLLNGPFEVQSSNTITW